MIVIKQYLNQLIINYYKIKELKINNIKLFKN